MSAERNDDGLVPQQLDVRSPVGARQCREIDATPVLPISQNGQFRRGLVEKGEEALQEGNVVSIVDRVTGEQDEIRLDRRDCCRDPRFVVPHGAEMEIRELNEPGRWARAGTSELMATDNDSVRFHREHIYARAHDRCPRYSGEPSATIHRGQVGSVQVRLECT